MLKWKKQLFYLIINICNVFCDAKEIPVSQIGFLCRLFGSNLLLKNNLLLRYFNQNSLYQHENKNLISCESAMVPHQKSKKNYSRSVIMSYFDFLNNHNNNNSSWSYLYSIGSSILESNINHNMQFSGDQEVGDITNTFLSKLFYQRDFSCLHFLPIRKKNELWYNQVGMKWNGSIEALQKKLYEIGEEHKKNLLKKDQEISTFENQINILRRREQSLQESNSNLSAELIKYKSDLENEKKTITEYTAKNSSLETECFKLKNKNEELENTNNGLFNQLKKVETDLEEQKTKNMDLKEQNKSQQEVKKTLEQKNKDKQSKIDEQVKKLTEQEKIILEHVEVQKEQKSELESLNKKLENRLVELEEKERLIKNRQNELENLNKQLNNVNAEKRRLLNFFSENIDHDDVTSIVKMVKEHKENLAPKIVESNISWWKKVYHKAKSWVRIYRSYEEIEDQRKFIDNLKEISNGLNYSYECIDHESSLWDIFKKSLTVSFGGYTRLGKCAMIGGLGAAGYIGCKFMPWSSLVGGTLPFFMEYWKFIIPALFGGCGLGKYVWSSFHGEELTKTMQIIVTTCNQCQNNCNQNAKLCGTCESKQIDNKNV